MSQVSEVARRYAKALFDITERAGTTAGALSDLQSIANALDSESKAFRVLLAPTLTDEEKNEFVKLSFSKGMETKEVQEFLFVLIEKERVANIFEIITAYQDLCDDKNDIIRGTVLSAEKLGDPERSKIEDAISKRLGKKTLINYREDPSVIGGITAEVGSYLFDGSIDSQIRKLNEDLMRSN